MTTGYPVALDTTATHPTNSGVGAQLSTFPHSVLHGNANDAIIAIETELGTAPSGSFSTVKSRFENIETAAWTTIAAGGNWGGNILYRKIGNILFIAGTITWSTTDGSSAAETVITLPVGFRPSTTRYVSGSATAGSVEAQTFQILDTGVVTKLGVGVLAEVYVINGIVPLP
jgi:hypothetical protein